MPELVFSGLCLGPCGGVDPCDSNLATAQAAPSDGVHACDLGAPRVRGPPSAARLASYGGTWPGHPSWLGKSKPKSGMGNGENRKLLRRIQTVNDGFCSSLELIECDSLDHTATP
jgi:hypothetical protein